MAERYPTARITAVSNSASQRRIIETGAADRGLANVRVITADMNDFDPRAGLDRIVSVEMFEHMANWSALLARVAPGWRRRRTAVRACVHPSQHTLSLRHGDEADWIAQHFFTGGIMPSHGLI